MTYHAWNIRQSNHRIVRQTWNIDCCVFSLRSLCKNSNRLWLVELNSERVFLFFYLGQHSAQNNGRRANLLLPCVCYLFAIVSQWRAWDVFVISVWQTILSSRSQKGELAFEFYIMRWYIVWFPNNWKFSQKKKL